MDRQPHFVSTWLLDGGLDLCLAAILAVMSFALGFGLSRPWPLTLDIAISGAAACAVRWPRIGGAALGVLLVGYFLVPAGSVSLGEYAPLIAILGTGIRNQRVARRWMTGIYGLVLIALQVKESQYGVRAVLGGLLWVAIIAVVWLIGNAFAALRESQAVAHEAVLVQQRLSLARDLHDTVARDLARASLRAQVAQQHLDPAEMGTVVNDIQAALAQLRLTMSLLRDPRTESARKVGDTESLAATLREAVSTLEVAGFAVTVTIDGDPSVIPANLWPTLRAVVNEATSNIERHATTSSPCAIVCHIDRHVVDIVFINHVPPPDTPPTGSEDSAMGLLGIRERLTPIGGQLTSWQEDTKWMTRITIPLPTSLPSLPSSSSTTTH